MSIIPQTGLLRKLFEEAVKDSEHKSLPFWQAYLQQAFSESDIYSVTATNLNFHYSSLEDFHEQADIIVRRYDDVSNRLISVLLLVECNWTVGVDDTEECKCSDKGRALEVALKCIEEEELLWVYVVTTVGVSFRAWVVEKGVEKLSPQYGLSASSSKGPTDAYIGIDTSDSGVLWETIDQLKITTFLQ
ncbi:hypothetical protein B7463_g11815, partial [Scytalidium lignicola]